MYVQRAAATAKSPICNPRHLEIQVSTLAVLLRLVGRLSLAATCSAQIGHTGPGSAPGGSGLLRYSAAAALYLTAAVLAAAAPSSSSTSHFPHKKRAVPLPPIEPALVGSASIPPVSCSVPTTPDHHNLVSHTLAEVFRSPDFDTLASSKSSFRTSQRQQATPHTSLVYDQPTDRRHFASVVAFAPTRHFA